MIILDTVHDFTNRVSYRLSYTCVGFTLPYESTKRARKNRSHSSINMLFVCSIIIFSRFTRGSIATFYIVRSTAQLCSITKWLSMQTETEWSRKFPAMSSLCSCAPSIVAFVFLASSSGCVVTKGYSTACKPLRVVLTWTPSEKKILHPYLQLMLIVVTPLAVICLWSSSVNLSTCDTLDHWIGF